MSVADGASHQPRRARLLSIEIVAGSIAVIIWLNILTNWTVFNQLWTGVPIPDTTSFLFDTSMRFVREALIDLTALLTTVRLARHNRATGRRNLVPVALIMGFIILMCSSARTLWAGYPYAVVLGGLRFAPLAMIAVCLRFYPASERSKAITFLARSAFLFAVVELGVAGAQVATAPAIFGSNFVGARAWGTFSSPDNLGLAAIGCLALMIIDRGRLLAARSAVPLLLCLTTGSRTAMLAGTALLAAIFLGRRLSIYAAAPLAPIAVLGLYFAYNSPAISGREINGEGRATVWLTALGGLHGPIDWLIGRGVGLGSNSVTTIFGKGSVGQIIVDSTIVTILLSYGAIGLGFAAYYLFRSLGTLDKELLWVVIPTVAFAAFSFNLLDTSPLNVITVTILGAGGRAYGGPYDSNDEESRQDLDREART